MYFPYVRGKQFELIALRDLCKSLPNFSTKISPVIEPVKNSSTFKSTLKALAESNSNFNVIINPRFGDFKTPIEIINILKSEIKQYQNYQIGIIIDEKSKSQLETIVDFINDTDLNNLGITLMHNLEISSNKIDFLTTNLNVKYNLIYFSKTSRRYYREFNQDTRVSLDDYFKELSRNVDYLNVDSNFSEEYRFYAQDGFVGFGDFLTIGDSYSETGFLPRAIAIHLSYIDENDKIRVKHFVSDSNGDTSDIGGKFAEALDKLVTWCNSHNINTKAVDIYRELHQRGHFPGLGTLKKLSIMNHIELIIDKI